MITKYIKETVASWKESDEVFYAYYDKDEADDYIESNLEEDEAKLTDEEWSEVVRRMDNDEGIWHELSQAFQHYINETIAKRKGNNGNNQ